jgi:hypothetical protein
MFPFPSTFNEITCSEGLRRVAIQNEDFFNKVIDKLPFKGPDNERVRLSDNVPMDIVKEHEEAEKSRRAQHEAHAEEEKQLDENSLEQEDEARRRAYSMFAPENRLDHWSEIEFERPNLHRKSSFHVGDERVAPEDANFLMTRTKRSDSFMERLKTGIHNLFRKGSKDHDELRLQEGQYAEVAKTEEKDQSEGLKPDVASQIIEKPLTREDIFEPEGNAENENPLSPGVNREKNLKAKKSKDSATNVLAERTNQVVSDLL